MAIEQLAEAISKAVRGAVVEVTTEPTPTVVVAANRLAQVCSFLKRDVGFDYLVSVTGVDYYEYFEVVYHLRNLDNNEQACLKVNVDHDEPVVPSVYSVWQGADLQEREVYDLMGIRFSGHPNLKRILVWDEFEGHPLRKDFGMANQDAWRQMPSMPQVET